MNYVGEAVRYRFGAFVNIGYVGLMIISPVVLTVTNISSRVQSFIKLADGMRWFWILRTVRMVRRESRQAHRVVMNWILVILRCRKFRLVSLVCCQRLF